MDALDELDDQPDGKPGSRKALILSVMAFLLAAGAGFFGSKMGFVPKFSQNAPSRAEETAQIAVAFLPLDRIVVTLPGETEPQQLSFAGTLEVAPVDLAYVEALKPRIADTLNGYLRAIDAEDVADAAQMARIRARMLHRVNLATGEVQVNDLLISEFALN